MPANVAVSARLDVMVNFLAKNVLGQTTVAFMRNQRNESLASNQPVCIQPNDEPKIKTSTLMRLV